MGINVRRTLAAGMILFMVCATGCASDKESDHTDPSGLTANFSADASPSCPSSGDTLSLHRQSVVGRIVTIGVQATDCDGSMGIFGVSFEVSFDPSIAQCSAPNPCSAGSLLSDPLATPQPVCVCDNASGHLLGSFSRKAPGTNQSISGSQDIVRFALEVMKQGAGRVDLVNTDDASGTALITLNGGPVEITGISYSGGSVVGQ